MQKRLPAFLSELPAAPHYNPIATAIDKTTDPEIVAALELFSGMPPSTGVFANPVRYEQAVACGETSVRLRIRSFGLRGCLLEEDIATGAADAIRTIFVGLFGRFARPEEHHSLSRFLLQTFRAAMGSVLSPLASFMKAFPNASPEIAMQHLASIRKACNCVGGVSPSRPPADLLKDLITVHLENTAAAVAASYMRYLLKQGRGRSAGNLARQTRSFMESAPRKDLFRGVFNLLLRRYANPTEYRILQTLGAIQVHHGSAGSNMVARYFASLHSRSVWDLFTAGQMALDCARHFGAITDLTEFVAQLERLSPSRRDAAIRQHAMNGNLPTFGHPEIAAAGRDASIEVDPRPAIYLFPLFEAIDRGKLEIPEARMKRMEIVRRMYQIAFVEGLEKPGRSGRLRIAPNTDFGGWIMQEALGIDELDRTLLSYVFRGFGWMMDVREQLQQPIIRPVIPPDPQIVPGPSSDDVISRIVDSVHQRLAGIPKIQAPNGATEETDARPEYKDVRIR